MDYSGGLVDYLANKKIPGDHQINANLRIAKEQGFISGGDMLVFENDTDQPRVITRNGLGNPDVNGFRNFVTLNGSLYVGTSSEANMGPTAGYRSEEHTSELQSLMRTSYAVFCLKKKK